MFAINQIQIKAIRWGVNPKSCAAVAVDGYT